MIHVRKGREPAALTTYRETPDRSVDPPRRAHYDGPGFERVKPVVREALVHEQRGLCCYCNARIVASNETTKIEHRVPQHGPHGDPSLDLVWSNLFGACHGRSVDVWGKATLHCDSAKGDQPVTLDPSNGDHMAAIGYERSGRITSRFPDHQRDLDAVLRLNSDALIARRQAVLDHVKARLARQYPDRAWPRSALERLRDDYDRPGTLDPDVGYLRWWLSRAIERAS